MNVTVQDKIGDEARKRDPQLDRLKKVPATLEARRAIWYAALEATRDTPRRRPMSRAELISTGNNLLRRTGMDGDHVGYAMVMLNNAFWLEQFLATPVRQRLLLLPRCLICLDEVLARARALGYKIIVADGTPVVVKILGEDETDAIIGVGCMDSLEKAFDKVTQVGVPSIAIPLNNDGCKNTRVDVDFLMWFLEREGTAAAHRTRNYLPAFRVVHKMFTQPEFGEIVGEVPRADEETARIACDWLRLGGKRLRPFITLAGYRAFEPEGDLPFAVKRVALAIEAFHKASLIHDDIEDDEDERYGEKTIHRRHGVPVAVNVGDYLLGMGYNLASSAAAEFGGDASSQLFGIFSKAHTLLAGGQGAELLWRKNSARELTLADVLSIYMGKTSPAFEAALASGLVMAGAYDKHRKTVRAFSKHLGAAYQITNDLGQWDSDAAHVRPTALLALALERCTGTERSRLLEPAPADEIRRIYERCEVFERAGVLIERFRVHASDLAERTIPEAFGELLAFLVETML